MTDATPERKAEPTVDPLKCPVCGTPRDTAAAECATCGWSPHPTSTAAIGVIVGVTILVCVGTIVVLPGLGIPLSIIAIAPLVRLSMVVHERTRRGLATPSWQQWAIFGTSLSLTLTILVTTAVVGTLSFCLGEYAGMSVLGGDTMETAIGRALLVGAILAVPAVGFVSWAFWKWVRRLWEQETRDAAE